MCVRTDRLRTIVSDTLLSPKGSFDAFKEALSGNATTVFGSGWGFLALDPATGDLLVVAKPNQDNPSMDGLITLLGIDVWEHAYYLFEGPKRANYVDNWVSHTSGHACVRTICSPI